MTASAAAPEDPSGRPSQTRRRVIALIVLAPVLGMLAAGVFQTLRPGIATETPCWILPNARVMSSPTALDCPLQPEDIVRRVEIAGETVRISDFATLEALLARARGPIRMEVERGNTERWVEVPVLSVPRSTRLIRLAVALLTAGFLLGIPIYLLWSTQAAAAIPLAVFYSIVSSVLATVLTGKDSAGMSRLSLALLVFAPAAFGHLSLTFPRLRPLMLHDQRVAAVPYAVSLLLLLIGWFTLERAPVLWPTFMYLLGGLTAGAWFVLLLSCAFALRETHSVLERAQARLVFYGALGLPVLVTLALMPAVETRAELVSVYIWSVPVAMPLPIALAISRYNLFELSWDVRYWIARLLFIGTSAIVVALILEVALRIVDAPATLREFAPLLLVSLIGTVSIELVRGRLPGFVESLVSPRMQQFRHATRDIERALSIPADEDAVAQALVQALQTGIAPRAGCVWLGNEGPWRPAAPFGTDAPARAALASEARRLIGGRRRVYMAAEPEHSAPELEAAGVELILSIEASGERFGLVLLGHPSHSGSYAGSELVFALATTARAGMALNQARLTSELLAAERQASAGRLVLGLAHEVGKELSWVRRLAGRLPERFDDRERLTRDAAMLRDLSESLEQSVRRLVRDATEQRDEPVEIQGFGIVAEGAVRRVERLHGKDRILVTLDPAVRGARCHENLGRVLINLLDNALHASPCEESVRLYATLEGAWIQIAIEDRGPGIPPDERAHVFEAGYTTRREQGGSGVGLTVAREIVSTLGGTLELDPAPDRGTRATLRIPVLPNPA
ncbi:MAG: ATP-binding protein [Myxococcota bacterium]|nr:ATP-binding protein [Myxococcota bacterium]